jgi:uncharacterized protein (TIGR01244 family)
MANIQQLDERTLVDGQITPADVAGLKAMGVSLVINNRPDREDDGQPTSDEVEAAVRAAGMDYRHVPIVRGMGPSDIEAMREALHAAGDGKVFAFCRSGHRSTLAWAVAKNEDGVGRATLEQCAANAGHNLDAVAHLLDD